MSRRPRTVRRELYREQAKLAAAKEKLWTLGLVASPRRPIPLDSASQVEIHAASMTCPICGDHFRVLEHTVLHIPGSERTLRVTHVLSPQCGRERDLYFALRAALPN